MEGRKEILTCIKRKKYHEIFLKDLEKVRLKKSDLSIKFHYRDMLAGNFFKVVQTTVGHLIQIQDAN